MKTNQEFKDLKVFMSKVKTVEEWNSRRQLAKIIYPANIISMLDASAYIKVVLNSNK